MNRAAIERFAVWAHEELVAQVTQRAYLYEITKKGCAPAEAAIVHGRPVSPEEAAQRRELIGQIERKGFDAVMEEVAYTWFNRFIVLRYMEFNDYLPGHLRVFTDGSGAFRPEILSEALQVESEHVDRDKVLELLDANRTEELYRYLLLALCCDLHKPLPLMFERLGSYTELLFPDNVLKPESILGRLVRDIPEEDWQDQVQIIGWLYQFYISKRHKEVVGLNKGIIKKEDIPAVTQIFTPDWIVRYMVENSLGKRWLDAHPEHAYLKEGWRYFVEEAEQAEDVRSRLTTERKTLADLKPQALCILDPCMGSGNILVYAFDVLIQIYRACGYSDREAVAEILEHNLYGLDVDDRCTQLAYFAVMMRARFYDRRLFARTLPQYVPHVVSIQESNLLAESLNVDGVIGDEWKVLLIDDESRESFNYLLQIFRDAKEYGSILRIEPRNYQSLRTAWMEAQARAQGNLMLQEWYRKYDDLVVSLIEQAEILSRRYEAIATNPPYINSNFTNDSLRKWAKQHYPDSCRDMGVMFMERGLDMLLEHGLCSMVTMHSWMFLSSFETFRKELLEKRSILSLAHLGTRAFDAIGWYLAHTCSFVLRRGKIKFYRGIYCRLTEATGQQEKADLFLSGEKRYVRKADDFSHILPGSPIAYWISEAAKKIFTESRALGDVAEAKSGTTAGDNNRFLRLWHEVNLNRIGFGMASREEALQSGKKWFPYNKGGSFRKWYGNQEYVVNWERDGEEVRNYKWASISNLNYWFQESVSWSSRTGPCNGILCNGFRFFPQGFAFDSAGNSAFGGNHDWKLNLVSYCNSKFFYSCKELVNPDNSFSVGYFNKLPYAEKFWTEETARTAERLIAIAKKDWDDYETSWDFETLPLLRPEYRSGSLKDSYEAMRAAQKNMVAEMLALETENNRRFNALYGLEEEIDPEVPMEQITLTCNPACRYGGSRTAEEKEALFLTDTVKELISYGVGCLFGRYAADTPGLIPSADSAGCDSLIEISDDPTESDDLTERFITWLRDVFGAETLEENLNFLAEVLDGKGSSRENLRAYFLNGFYADHVKRYQKRPIYWLFDSGKKNGLKALLYMHRYTPDTVARLRTDFVHRRQDRLQAKIEQLSDKPELSAKESRELKRLRDQTDELHTYEKKVRHLADSYISLDLDDGVKVNYAKLSVILAKIS